MNLRRSTFKDIPAVQRLLHQVLMVHYNARPDLFKAGTSKYTDQELAEIIKDDNRPIFVCVDSEDNVLGYAFLVVIQLHNNNMTDIKTLYIDDLCVDEKYRGQKVGKTIYEYILKYARDNNFYNITLNVWMDNTQAYEFYKHLGLTPQKLTMEKIL